MPSSRPKRVPLFPYASSATTQSCGNKPLARTDSTRSPASSGLVRYRVTATRHPLDEEFPEWGESSYYTVELYAECRLQDLLSHLYVLIPVLDDDKHYWVGGDEVGPDLTAIGGRLDRETILGAIVAPNNRIAEGFEDVTLTLVDGSRLIGRVLEENESSLKLELVAEVWEADPEEDWWEEESSETGEVEEIEANPHSIVDNVAEDETAPVLETRLLDKSQIQHRRRNLSAMPENSHREHRLWKI